MNIDVAVASTVFAAGVRRKFDAVRPCIADDLGFPLSGFFVDHLGIELPSLHRVAATAAIRLADGSEVKVNSYRMQLWTDVKVHLTTLKDVQAGGLAGPTGTIPLTFKVYFDVVGELQTDQGGNVIGAGIRTRYAGKDTSMPTGELDTTVDAALAAADEFVPIDIGPLGQAFGKPLEIRNVGVATDYKGSRAVIRLEVDTVATDPVAAWQKFYGSPPDLLAGRDWAIFVDRRMLTGVAKDQIKAAIAKDQQLSLNEGPTTYWWPWIPGFKIEVGITLVDVCPAFDMDIDVDVDAETSIKVIGTAGNRQLQLEVKISWDATDSDVIKCGVATGVLQMKYGASIGSLAGPVGALIGAVAVVVLVTVAVAITADLASPPSGTFEQPDCKTIEKDDDHVVIRCTRPLVMPAIPLLGKLDPDEVAADDQGLYLRGATLLAPAGPGLVLEVRPLQWVQQVTCSALQVQWVKEGWVKVSGMGLRVCRIDVLDDPFGVFSASWDSWSGTIGVALKKQVQKQYFAKPYPCVLAIRTNQGARCANLGALKAPPPPPSELQKLVALDKNCWKFYRDIPIKGFDPGWWAIDIELTIDAPVIRHWDVAVFGLPEGSIVDLCKILGLGCDPLASAPVNPRGHVRLQATTTPRDRLRIRSHGAPIPDGPLDPRRHGFAITQRLFVQERVLELPGACRDLAAFEGIRGVQLAAVTDAGLHVWKQHPVHALVPTMWWLSFAAREVVPVLGGFATIGDHGVTVFRAEEGGGVRVVATRSGLDALREIAHRAELTTEGWRNRRASASAPWLDRAVWVAPFVVRLGLEGRQLEVYRASRPVEPAFRLGDVGHAPTESRRGSSRLSG